MRKYAQFNVESVFPEPGGLLYVTLGRNGKSHQSNATGNLERVLEEANKQSDLIVVPVEQIRLHLLKLMNGLVEDLLSDRKPNYKYIKNVNALMRIVRYVEKNTPYKLHFKTRTSQVF